MYEEKDLRYPLGKSNNELVVVVLPNYKICFKFWFLQSIANVVAVLLGCIYEEKDLRYPLGKSSNELVVVSIEDSPWKTKKQKKKQRPCWE